MKEYNTVLELICAVAGWQGGTIHQALDHFKSLTLTEQTAIYFKAVQCGLGYDESNDLCSVGFSLIQNIVVDGNIERFNGMVALCATS